MRLGHAAWWLLAGATADVEVRHALLLAGGVSPLAERWSKIGGGAVARRSRAELSDVELCAATVRRHVLRANGDRRWDAFAHGWRLAGADVEDWYRASYDLSAAVFEDNDVAVARANLTTRFAGESFGRLSHTLSMARVAALALAREAEGDVAYDRFVLVRPDVLLLRDLHVAALPRGRPYCNSHGRAAGDFHFVFERDHVEAVAAALAPGREAAPGPRILSGHNNMRNFLALAFAPPRGAMAIDAQLFAGFDEDVYRKFPFHVLFKCTGVDVARVATDHFAVLYNLSATSRAAIAARAAPFECPPLGRTGDFAVFSLCVRRPAAPDPPRIELLTMKAVNRGACGHVFH